MKVTYDEESGVYLITVGEHVGIYMKEDEAQFLMDELDWALNPREDFTESIDRVAKQYREGLIKLANR